MFYKLLEKIGFTKLETKLAALLGRLYRNYILKNRTLSGDVGKVYMTRAKIRGKSKNIIHDGFVDEDKIKEENDEVYEVVYQAWLNEEHVLSLGKNQLWMVGKEIEIIKYWVVIHLGHRFVIGSDIEIYPGLIAKM